MPINPDESPIGRELSVYSLTQNGQPTIGEVVDGLRRENTTLRMRNSELRAAIYMALSNIEGDPSYPETERILRESLKLNL